MNRELLQQALDVLKSEYSTHGFNIGHLTEVTPDTVTLIEDSLNGLLAKPEQDKTQQALDKKADNARELGLDYEPVLCGCGDGIVADSGALCGICASLKPIREWVGLTNEEIKNILDCGRGGLVDIKKAEAKLKEKNHAV